MCSIPSVANGFSLLTKLLIIRFKVSKIKLFLLILKLIHFGIISKVLKLVSLQSCLRTPSLNFFLLNCIFKFRHFFIPFVPLLSNLIPNLNGIPQRLTNYSPDTVYKFRFFIIVVHYAFNIGLFRKLVQSGDL